MHGASSFSLYCSQYAFSGQPHCSLSGLHNGRQLHPIMELRLARSAKKSFATPRTLIPRRSSSVDVPNSGGGTTGRKSRSGWTPAMSGGRNRRSSSMSQVDRLSQGAPRGANLKDQRPFHDKAYISLCVDKLYTFLQETAYPHHTTPQKLSRMSGKEFENVITFLIRFFEPNFKLGGGPRMEDLVLEQLRSLGYPYPLHKSMLMGIGSQPHKALAIITWLADLAKYHETVSPLDDFFVSEDAGIGTPGLQPTGGNCVMGLLLRHCLESREDDSDFDEDAFLDNLVLEAVGPMQPVEEIEKKLAEQQEEVERLMALVEEQDMRKQELQKSRRKIQDFEKYFEDMAAHFEAKRLDVQKNEEELTALGATRDELKEQLADVEAVLREQHARHEDVPAMQQRQQRLQQDLSAARSRREELRQQQEVATLKVYSITDKLRSENAKLQAYLKSSTSCLHRVLPRNALDDFDLQSVEDARSLQRYIASNTAAASKVANQLSEIEKELQGCIQQDQDLCEQYAFKVEDLERDLELKQELIAKRRVYLAEQTADTRKNAHDLDKEYADICKATSDLQQNLTTDAEVKAAQESEKRLRNLEKQLAEARSHRNETIAASDDALEKCKKTANATYMELVQVLEKTNDLLVDAVEELNRIKKKIKKRHVKP